MYRDKGPNHSLGFGVTQGQLPIDEVTETPDPQAGIVARALNERPVAKFFAAAGATIVGAAVSGSLVRRAGVRGLRTAAQRAARDPNSTSAGFMKEYRKVQSIFDDYGGIQRIKHSGRMDLEGGKVVHFDDPGLDVTYKSDSFVFTQGERERMRSMGGELPLEWTLKDEMQQQAVRAARRLPYELPAVYVTQRAFTDKLLDTGPEERVNWSNPVDIVGDFARQSMANVAMAFAPFTAGGAAVQHGWRKALTSSVDQAAPAGRRAVHNAIIDINDSLDLIGQEASDLIAKASQVSSRSMGAASTAITQTASRQQSMSQTLHSLRHGEGGFTGWLNRIRTGEEVFGPVSQIRDMARNYKAALPNRVDSLDDVYTNVYRGGSKYDDISSSIRNLQGQNFSDGAFYQALAAAEYKKIMSRQLSDMGVDKKVAQEFSNVANFTLPMRPGQQTHLSERVMFGKRAGGKIDEGTGAWTEAFKDRVEPVYRGHGQVISSKIDDAIRVADKEFLALKPQIDQKIGRSWSKAFRETVSPEAARMLGTRKAAFAEFGDQMSPGSAEFMVRRSAERLGIPTATPMGSRVSTADLKSRLSGYGLDPNNRHRMRSFLVEQGDISKPWNPTARNLFGLRPMSIQEGLDRKVLGHDVKDADQLAKAIARSDWDPNILNRVKAGGLYETASGQVADFTPLQRGARNFMDKLATEIEVPVLHFNPLQMFGYGARSEAAQRGAIQFTAGRQPFTGAAGRDADGFFWFQQRHSKGRVAALRMGEGADARTTFLDGSYRPFTADQSMTGRALHLAAGDNVGRARVQREGFWGRTADKMDVDPYQPGSIGSGIRRMRSADRQDIRNPSVFARRMMEGGDDVFPGTDPAIVAEGGRNFLNYLRNASLGSNVAAAGRRNQTLLRMTHVEEPLARGVAGPPKMRSVFDMDASALRTNFRRLLGEDPASIGVTDDALAGTLGKAQRSLLKRWADTENLASFDQPLHRMARTGTMNQRIDQARMDMVRYLTMREGLRGGQSPAQLRKSLGDVADEIGGLQGRGAISSREAAEARAALGSVQASFTNLRTYDPQRSSQDQILNVIDNLRGSRPGVNIDETMRQILDDAANYGVSGRMAGKVRKHLAPGKYRFEGTEYNPFGASTILTPTFGTAFNRNPMRATLSAMGVRTWDDPDSFSGAGIGVSHMFERMNRATQVLGLGVDSAKYHGPLDMFHRGMIMKRAVPLVAGGTTAMAVDRTAGAYVHGEVDEHGDRVYKPLVMGALGEVGMEAQATISGLTPGGMSYQEKKDQLLHGDVAVRRGRWWPFGNTPWKGGQVDYYRPSWYRRLQSGYQYTSQTYGSPMERLMFGHDFSPLRPLDPYRFERQHYDERPYPETGDYFTGPWGPATGVLNMTVGRILKPRQKMHEGELQWEMSRFQQVGSYGMAPPNTPMAVPHEPTIARAIAGTASGGAVMPDTPYTLAAGSPAYLSGSKLATQDAYAEAGHYAAAAKPWYTSSQEYPYVANMTDTAARGPSNVTIASEPISAGSLEYQLSESAFLMQEWSGIYGFAFGAGREALGLGGQRFERDRPILAQASQAYGTSRQFWDLGIGGLGDFPSPVQGMGSLELSELVRRFVPKPRSGQDWVNPLRNVMGVEHPWLPGDEYFTNFHTGDPYTEVTEGEMRLPGQGYERFNQLHSDETGRYGRLDRFRILADVAPYSNEFRMAAAELRNSGLSLQEREIYEETMGRVEERKRRHEFVDREHTYSPGFGGAPELWERFKHMDTYFHKKLLPDTTAVEDWERHNIYGSSFPEWQRPIESFVKPAVYKATDKNPLRAGVGLAVFGHLFGATPRAKAAGRLMGGLIGTGASAFGSGYEAITGQRYIPAQRKHEMAVEEYTDILKYTRAMRGFNLAQEHGDFKAAEQFRDQMKSTMYGVDLFDSTPEEMARAVPKRKREHFAAMLEAPEQERERILSTAGRLERRMYQAHWGLSVERRPDLGEYFEQHELPGPQWEGWDPRVDMNQVEIKMLQREGLNASQMGYYPQQVREANLVNPAFPEFGGGSPNARAQLERLMSRRGMRSDVREIRTPFPGVRVNVNSGV